MQFILTGYDATDKDALSRRMDVREEHLANVKRLKKTGNFIWGGAILSDEGAMIGSVIVYDYNSRAELDKMLKTEPYILGGVWEKVRVKNFKLAAI